MGRLILVILLVLCVSAYADINPDRDSLVVMTFEQSLVPDTGNALIDTLFGRRAINRAISQVSHDFPAIERYDTVVTVDGTRLYSINTDFLRLKAAIKYTTEQEQNIIIPLDYPPIENWYDTGGGSSGSDPPFNEKDEPRYVWVFGGNLYFYPTPTDADTVIVAYYAADTALTTATSETSILPEYREAIIFYAASIICMRKGDFTRAQLYQGLYNAKLSASVQIREPEKKQ